MLWDEDIPRLRVTDDGDSGVEVTVIAGALEGPDALTTGPPAPPPRSWASRPDADVAIWHVRLDPGARWQLPPARSPETVRTLYVFDGSSVTIGDREVAGSTAAVVRSDEPIAVIGGPDAVEILMLQGRPIGEPVAQYGPFVMNTETEIEQAFLDYRETGFGGWPWPLDDPVHGLDPRRFAQHADGRVEQRT